MPRTQATAEKVRDRAIEVGVYLPLGLYSRFRDEIAETDRKSLNRTYKKFVRRGKERVGPIEDTLKRRARRVERTAAKTTGRAPKLPRVAAPRRASDLPIPSYASKTGAEIVSELGGLTNLELAKVYKFERAHENRATVLEAIESKLVDLPIATYDALTVDEIKKRLESLSEKELKVIHSYEERTKGRATVLEKSDQLLSA